jgi:hypothetical protein
MTSCHCAPQSRPSKGRPLSARFGSWGNTTDHMKIHLLKMYLKLSALSALSNEVSISRNIWTSMMAGYGRDDLVASGTRRSVLIAAIEYCRIAETMTWQVTWCDFIDSQTKISNSGSRTGPKALVYSILASRAWNWGRNLENALMQLTLMLRNKYTQRTTTY